MRVSDLKVFLFDKMNRLSKKLSNNDKMRIAISLDISVENVKSILVGK